MFDGMDNLSNEFITKYMGMKHEIKKPSLEKKNLRDKE